MKTHPTKILYITLSLGLLTALLCAQPAFAQSTAKPKPASARAPAPADIDKRVDAAASAYQAGRHADAARLFGEVVKLDPRHVQAWHFLGQSLVKTGQTMEARAAFQRALEIDPSGKVAERTREALAKLPPPDLTQISLPSGLTLKDWLDLAAKRAAAGEGRAVLSEVAGYIKAYGALPQLTALRDRLAAPELARIKTSSPEAARAALGELKTLRDLVGEAEPLVQKEALAHHTAGNYAAAQQAYARWLKLAAPDHKRRAMMVENLMKAQKGEAVVMKVDATGQIIRDCADCPEMVVLSAGSFEMGEANDKHTVTFAQPFAIGKTEVTQGQWQAIMSNNPSHFKDCGANCPVEQVSWDDAQEFIRRLNAKTGKPYRLPSEAEWEAACRGGEEQEYCGSDDINSVAWYGAYATPAGNSAKTTNPVATKRPNAFGLYDMSGNVWEWVQDCHNASYSGAPGDGSAWQSGNCTERVLRGGSWLLNPQNSRAAFRLGYSPAFRKFNLGLRLARMLP